jgi:hypothetical protein
LEKTFSHRFNRDGTVDSICHSCFMTVATATHEAELENYEQNHLCDPRDKLRSEVLAEEAKLTL